jgi:hypothetical protein
MRKFITLDRIFFVGHKPKTARMLVNIDHIARIEPIYDHTGSEELTCVPQGSTFVWLAGATEGLRVVQRFDDIRTMLDETAWR